jgi:hypothetical protein
MSLTNYVSIYDPKKCHILDNINSHITRHANGYDEGHVCGHKTAVYLAVCIRYFIVILHLNIPTIIADQSITELIRPISEHHKQTRMNA